MTKKSAPWKRVLFAVFICGAMVPPALALFDRGGIIGVGARAMGLSGAFTAVADDASAAYWNPAGLAQLDAPEILGMYGSYLNGLSQDLYFSFHYPFPKDIHAALSIDHSFFPDSTGIQEDQLAFSVAIPADFVAGKRLFLGANFRYLYAQEGGGNGTAQGAAADLGMLLRLPFKNHSQLKAALTLTDISTSVHYNANGLDQSIPALLTAGFAYQMGTSSLFSIDIPWMLDKDLVLGSQGLDDVRIRGGVEQWLINGRLGLRAGVISFFTLPAEFSLGAGLRLSDMTIDGAFSSHSQLGNNYRISIGLSLDKGVPEKPQPRPRIVRSLVGNGEIYLRWEIPDGSHADGYTVWIREESAKEYRRARREPLQSGSCLLRGTKNGYRYHIYVRSIVQGKEKYLSEELVVTSHPMAKEAREFYDRGLVELGKKHWVDALSAFRKAEEFDPDDYEIKDILIKLKTPKQKGLVPEANAANIQP